MAICKPDSGERVAAGGSVDRVQQWSGFHRTSRDEQELHDHGDPCFCSCWRDCHDEIWYEK